MLVLCCFPACAKQPKGGRMGDTELLKKKIKIGRYRKWTRGVREGQALERDKT